MRKLCLLYTSLYVTAQQPTRTPVPSYLDPRTALTLFKPRNATPLYEEGYVLMVILFLLLALLLLVVVLVRTRKYLVIHIQPALSPPEQRVPPPQNQISEDPTEISGISVNPLAATSTTRTQATVSPVSPTPAVKPVYTCPGDQRPDLFLLNKVHPLFIWLGIINFFVFIFGFVVAYAPWVVMTLPPPFSNYTLELTLFNAQTLAVSGGYLYYVNPPVPNNQVYKNRPYDRASSDVASLTAAFFFAHCYWLAAIAMIQGFVAHRAVRAKYTLIKRGRNRPNCCMNCCDCPDCCCDCCPVCFSNARCSFRLNFIILFSLFITICAGSAPFQYRNANNLRPTGAGLGFAILCFLLSFIATSLAGGALEMLLDASLQPGSFALKDLAEGGENTTVAQVTSGFNPQVLPAFGGDFNRLVMEMRSRQQSQQLMILQKLRIPPQPVGVGYSYASSNVMMLPQQMMMMPQPRLAIEGGGGGGGGGGYPQMGPQTGAYPQMGPQTGAHSQYPQIMPYESYTIPLPPTLTMRQPMSSPLPVRGNWQPDEESTQGAPLPLQVVAAPGHGLSPAQFAELEARRRVSRGQTAETSAMRRADSVTNARMTPEQKELHALRNAQVKSSFPPVSASVSDISVVPTSPPRLPPDQ